MNALSKIIKSACWLWGIALLAKPLLVEAIEYELLRPLPGFEPTIAGNTSLVSYLQNSFNLIIGIAAIGAILAGVIFGFEYVVTSARGPKSEAKKHLLNIAWGLALLLGAYLILYTINPALLRLDASLAKLQYKVPVINNAPTNTVASKGVPYIYGSRPSEPGEVIPPDQGATTAYQIQQVFDPSQYLELCEDMFAQDCAGSVEQKRREFTSNCTNKTYRPAGSNRVINGITRPEGNKTYCACSSYGTEPGKSYEANFAHCNIPFY